MGVFGKRIGGIVAGLVVSTYVRISLVEIHAGYHLPSDCQATAKYLGICYDQIFVETVPTVDTV